MSTPYNSFRPLCKYRFDKTGSLTCLTVTLLYSSEYNWESDHFFVISCFSCSFFKITLVFGFGSFFIVISDSEQKYKIGARAHDRARYKFQKSALITFFTCFIWRARDRATLIGRLARMSHVSGQSRRVTVRHSRTRLRIVIFQPRFFLRPDMTTLTRHVAQTPTMWRLNFLTLTLINWYPNHFAEIIILALPRWSLC